MRRENLIKAMRAAGIAIKETHDGRIELLSVKPNNSGIVVWFEFDHNNLAVCFVEEK